MGLSASWLANLLLTDLRLASLSLTDLRLANLLLTDLRLASLFLMDLWLAILLLTDPLYTLAGLNPLDDLVGLDTFDAFFGLDPLDCFALNARDVFATRLAELLLKCGVLELHVAATATAILARDVGRELKKFAAQPARFLKRKIIVKVLAEFGGVSMLAGRAAHWPRSLSVDLDQRRLCPRCNGAIAPAKGGR